VARIHVARLFILIGRFAAGAGRLGAESAYIRVIRGQPKAGAQVTDVSGLCRKIAATVPCSAARLI